MMKATPTATEGARLSITASPKDNVATLLDYVVDCKIISGGMAISPGIPFGHKVALCDISKGDEIVKYGVVIGWAIIAIRAGDHVHVHNIA